MRSTRLGRLIALPLACAAAIPASMALADAHAAGHHNVVLKEIRFHPGNLTINRGDSVTWLWRDGEEHNVTFRFNHSRTQSSGSYTLHFSRSGTFNYRCTIHGNEGMRGKIVVR